MRLLFAIVALSASGSGVLAATSADPRVALVSNLYAAYAWEALDADGKRESFNQEKKAVLEAYVTPALAALLLRDRQCVARSHEICHLDFLPMWDSQDPDQAKYRVVGLTYAGSVGVQVTYANDGRHDLQYYFAQVAGEWRIDDIRGKKWSLRKLLSAK